MMEYVSEETLQALRDMELALGDDVAFALGGLLADLEDTYRVMGEDPMWEGTSDAEGLQDAIDHLHDAVGHLRRAAEAVYEALGC